MDLSVGQGIATQFDKLKNSQLNYVNLSITV